MYLPKYKPCGKFEVRFITNYPILSLSDKMPVVINYKICNKGRTCPCINACPTNAWYWDEENKRPAVDNSKCTNCGMCTKVCPARVISGALDEKGIKKIEEEIKNDPRSQEFLNKERFNLPAFDKKMNLNENSFEEFINSNDTVIIDFWTPKFSARCKLSTMAYDEIIPEGVPIRKVDILENQELCKKIGVTTLPALIVFHKGKIVDHIAAKVGLAEKELIKGRLRETLNKI